jgi:hypothetical protein
MKKITLFALVLITISLVTGCADVTNVQDCIPAGEHTYGFWGGVWHGMIQPFSFIGSLIWDDVDVYARNNNGGWYDFGFVGGLGLMIKLFGYIIKGITATTK